MHEIRPESTNSPGKARVSVGVVSPLTAPTPMSSPIGIDVAMAWFYKGEQQEIVANLCTLAGVNWVRDRLLWGEMEPSRGEFSKPNRYDDTARKQSAAGLRVLQVMHLSPQWANTNMMRFPLDLRDVHRFMREMAVRWKGQVQAFEPWNEADIKEFGGHSGTEMAALQKAAYLGLKAGNPEMIVCQNVFALPNPGILEDLNDNRAWPYFETFNLHHYIATEGYPGLYKKFRDVSAGKPLWVTEFSMPVKWPGDAAEQEPAEADLRIQAERVGKVFATALNEGPTAAFYFMLPNYCEGQTQFGILHKDMTPRPAYVALAAVGRLLADAKAIGVVPGATNVHAYVFSAKPDGEAKQVLVAWSDGEKAAMSLRAKPVAVFDHFGRPITRSGDGLELTGAPVFALFETNAGFGAVQLRAAVRVKTDSASPIVLQSLIAPEQLNLSLSAYRISSEKTETISVFAYNFSAKKVSGALKVTGPKVEGRR